MKLPQVTLCTIDSNPVLAIRAMNLCLDLCEFGDAVLITNTQAYAPFRVAYNDMKHFAHGWYTDICMYQLLNYINTDFVLMIQYDGYVLNPGCWDNEFLKYDYIGAVWPWPEDSPDFNHMVGNGGFSLRSRRLLEILLDYPLPEKGKGKGMEVEDAHICRFLKEDLEARGIKFAPPHVARRFSYELEGPAAPTFGFHGVANLCYHMPEREMIKIAPHFASHTIRRNEFKKGLIPKYIKAGSKDVLAAFKDRMAIVPSKWSEPDLPNLTPIIMERQMVEQR